MKILFVLKQTGYLRHFDTVVQTLADQGHEIRLASQNDSLKLPSTLQDLPRVSITTCPKKRGDAWAKDVSLFRRAEDYLRYLEGPYTPASILLSPNSIYAEPFAFFKTPALIITFLVSLTVLPSERLPFSSNKTTSVSLPPNLITSLQHFFHHIGQIYTMRILLNHMNCIHGF